MGAIHNMKKNKQTHHWMMVVSRDISPILALRNSHTIKCNKLIIQIFAKTTLTWRAIWHRSIMMRQGICYLKSSKKWAQLITKHGCTVDSMQTMLDCAWQLAFQHQLGLGRRKVVKSR